jgi:hypothetical protein
MVDIEDMLKRKLFRATCPESVELGELHLGLVPPERVTQLHSHMAACPHCTREFRQLHNFLQDVAPDLEHSFADKVRVWIARLLPAGEAGAQATPAFALRGHRDEPRTLLYEAGEAQLTLEVQQDPDSPGEHILLGLLLGVTIRDVAAFLWQDEQQVATVAVDMVGNFSFSSLEAGRYELLISGPAFEIHVQELLIP